MHTERVSSVAVAACLALALSSAGCGGSRPASRGPAPLFDDLGDHHHEITTDSPETQGYFDQGLTLTYGFNHAEAIRSFRAGAALDPACAMCYWGVAYALGPNINAPMGGKAAVEAFAALHKALELAPAASEREQAYIEALSARYAPFPADDRTELDLAYAEAMRDVADRYPDDLDAVTLYAEALMDTTPWDYWQADGKPRPATAEVLTALESVLERDPYHPGANHYYIHAIEASPEPERAEAAADRLGGIAPGAGHLVHMPAHIYLRVGRYADASEVNILAAAADESYITQCNVQGFYPALYYPHNIHFLWYTASIEGRSELALDSARRLARSVTDEQVRMFPEIEWYRPVPTFTYARFAMWDRILTEPAPPEDFLYSTAVWHYARGIAHASRGELERAEEELAALDAILTSDEMQGYETAPGQPPVAELTDIAHHLLMSEVARLSGHDDRALVELESAVAVQDNLPYMEPPYWYYPARQSLGALYLRLGRPADAERAYRDDLDAHPDNGWSLFGLMQALDAQDRDAEAAAVRERFEKAWALADVRLGATRP